MNKNLMNLLLRIFDSLEKDLENKHMKEIYLNQSKSKERILRRVTEVIMDNTLSDNHLLIETRDRVQLKREMSRLVAEVAESEAQVETNRVEKMLAERAEAAYNVNTYVYESLFVIDYEIKLLPDERIREIARQEIQGKNWKSRLWANKRGLERDLRKNLYDMIDGKTDIDKISRLINERYGGSFSDSRRLARTEGARVQSSVIDEWAENNGIAEQLFTATLDNKTSNICSKLDGERYKPDDPDKPSIPEDTHPNCRSVLVNVPYEGWTPTARLDNITKERIDYKTYKEWAASR